MLTAARKEDMKLGRIAKHEESVSRFIPYARLVDAHTIKTKDKMLLQVIKLDGIPFETMDEADIIDKKETRKNMLRTLSNSRFAIYHHIIRREERPSLDGLFENDWCRDLDSAYQKRLSTKRMYVNEQFITIVRRPAPGAIGFLAELSRTFFSKIDKEEQEAQEKVDLKALNDATAAILSALSEYKPRLLGLESTDRGVFSEPLSFLSYLINLEKVDIRPPRRSIADYLPSKRIFFGKEALELYGSVPGDTKLASVLSVKEYAPETEPGMLDSLLRLPYEFNLTQSFGFVDRQATLNVMREIKRKLISGDQGAITLEEQMDDAIDDLSSGESTFGEHHLTITVIGKSAPELNNAINGCVSAFINRGIVVAREDINLEPAFWAQLPGNFSYIARRALVSNANFAGLASLHNFPVGKAENNHWGSPISLLETTSGTPYWFNFHAHDVGNFTVIGPTGTGKTVLLTFLNAQAQRLKPITIYFDKDHGAEIYMRAIGGTYTTISQGTPTGLNPMQLPDTPENRAFLREWVKWLITCDNNLPLSPEDQDVIARAVNANFTAPMEHRRLGQFAHLLAGHEKAGGNSMAARIAKWHGQGERAWLFDNAQDALSLDNRNIGFDLTSILDDPVSRTPWLMYIFHRVQEILNGQKVIIMLDEGWKLLDDPAFSAKIKDWMKTIRKQNGIIGFATQSTRDAMRSSVGDAIIEQSPTQIFLPNHIAMQDDYCNGFGLSLEELRIVRSLSRESRCFLLKHGKDSVIAKLDLSGMDSFINVLSGRTGTVAQMHDLIRQYGENPSNWLPELSKRRTT